MPINCPVCGGLSKTYRELPDVELRELLVNYFNAPLPDAVDIRSYSMQRCGTCDLAFASPMSPGRNEFYLWITSQPGYYPQHRWEWEVVISMIGSARDQKIVSVMDVGCGSGDFLCTLAKNAGTSAIGLDTTPSSIEACIKRNVNAVRLDINGFCELYPESKFDYCVSYHCIEHVEDPFAFMMQMKKLAKKDGKLIISAPYSPMSFEEIWFDPLNHPPHHLTRWNQKSLEELARKLGMTLHLMTSTAAPLRSRALRALQLATTHHSQRLSFFQKLRLMMEHPLMLSQSFVRQALRERMHGEVAGDTFLAVFEFK